jgi:hypothetical protein
MVGVSGALVRERGLGVRFTLAACSLSRLWQCHALVHDRGEKGGDTHAADSRKKLWPSGLQYNARHMQIAWPSISLCTGILARC